MSTYVYAVVRASHPLRGELPPGVGEPPAEARLLTEGDVGAVVSDAPEGLRAKRRDLMAHQSLLDVLAGSGPVLPMRFGSLAADDAEVRSVLAERGEHFAARLGELDGKIEFNVKAAHREDDMLRLIVSRDAEIRELNQRSRETGDQQDRLRLGELVAAAVQEQEARDAEMIRATLRPFASDENQGPAVSDLVCNVSYLVDRSAADEFRAAVARLETEHGHLEVSLHGPMPPYSFVETAKQTA